MRLLCILSFFVALVAGASVARADPLMSASEEGEEGKSAPLFTLTPTGFGVQF